MRKPKIYAVYKGDTYLTQGTRKEIADYLGIKTRTLDFYASNTYKKRNIEYNKRIIIMLIKDLEEY